MPTDEAQRILDAVNREEMLSLAQELIKIPSFKTEETEVARFLGDFLGQGLRGTVARGRAGALSDHCHPQRRWRR